MHMIICEIENDKLAIKFIELLNLFNTCMMAVMMIAVATASTQMMI